MSPRNSPTTVFNRSENDLMVYSSSPQQYQQRHRTVSTGSGAVQRAVVLSSSPTSPISCARSTSPKRRTTPGRTRSFPREYQSPQQQHQQQQPQQHHHRHQQQLQQQRLDFDAANARIGLSLDHELRSPRTYNNKKTMFCRCFFLTVSVMFIGLLAMAGTMTSTTTKVHHYLPWLMAKSSSKPVNKAKPVGLGFSPLSTVSVQDKGTIPISELEVGDMVMGGNGQYQAVLNLGDSNPSDTVHYIHIHTKPRRQESIFVNEKDDTTTNNNMRRTYQQQQRHNTSTEKEDDFLMALDVTGEQMIYLYGAHRPILAQHVQVGDLLAGGDGQALEVAQIYKMPRHGRYAPIVHGGTILVNGFVAAASGPHRQGKEGLRPALLTMVGGSKVVVV